MIALAQLKRVTRFWPLATSDSVLLHVDAGRAQIQGLLSLVAPETSSATPAPEAAPSALELQQQIERIIVFERQSLSLPMLPTAPPRFTGRHVVLRTCIHYRCKYISLLIVLVCSVYASIHYEFTATAVFCRSNSELSRIIKLSIIILVLEQCGL